MLGLDAPYDDVPFFWSAHFGTTISYTGHADSWDRAELTGSLDAGSASVGYWKGDQVLAVATLGRDRDALIAEQAMLRNDQDELASLVRTG
jgi:3-phenylpropionate/trans-cinnamate dioxygenase ferredoxin reductase subunit